MSEREWRIQWNHGGATISQLGAMLAPALFRLDNGREIQPFAIAPWSGDTSAEHEALPGVLKRLRGEWACVPFGMPAPPAGLPTNWAGTIVDDESALSPDIHGPSSNDLWRLDRSSTSSLQLSLDYPARHPIARLTRSVQGVDGSPALAFGLTITPRTDTVLPIGIHPVFRLPEKSDRAMLHFDGDVRAYTYPISVEPGVSRFVTGARAERLEAIPCLYGRFADITRHPLPFRTEERGCPEEC